MIEEKSVESYSSFTNESKGKKKRRIDKAKKEASEVQSSMNDLASVIAARQAVRSENLVESLEKKYCKPKRGKKR